MVLPNRLELVLRPLYQFKIFAPLELSWIKLPSPDVAIFIAANSTIGFTDPPIPVPKSSVKSETAAFFIPGVSFMPVSSNICCCKFIFSLFVVVDSGAKLSINPSATDSINPGSWFSVLLLRKSNSPRATFWAAISTLLSKYSLILSFILTLFLSYIGKFLTALIVGNQPFSSTINLPKSLIFTFWSISNFPILPISTFIYGKTCSPNLSLTIISFASPAPLASREPSFIPPVEKTSLYTLTKSLTSVADSFVGSTFSFLT